MIKLLTAQEANWHAKQRTVITGILETLIYPKILHEASFGRYEAKIILESYDVLAPETVVNLMGILQKNGYSVKVKNKIMIIEWKD